jgi:hypothetical protein
MAATLLLNKHGACQNLKVVRASSNYLNVYSKRTNPRLHT